MPTLNRFPLLGLWAEEAARRLGYRRDEAESLGHAYAVLYAIRANRRQRAAEGEHGPARPKAERPAPRQLRFGGDELDVVTDNGHVRGLVGGDRPQTPASYRSAVRAKFPAGYYDELRRAFARVWKTFPPQALRGRVVYDLYDQWKRLCGVGRRVELDRLLQWCEQRAGTGGRGVKSPIESPRRGVDTPRSPARHSPARPAVRVQAAERAEGGEHDAGTGRY